MTTTPESVRAGLRKALLAALLLAVAAAAPAQSERRGGPDAETSPVWLKVRASLFGTRPIASPAADVIELQAPDRAEDAAVVPLAVTVGFPQSAARRVERIWLVIDENPSPISAVFQFGPRSGRADLETRVRINDYTFVRAIAELADGSLHMSTRYVKAAGGCSAPPGKDREAALANLGRMRLRMDPPADGARPALAQLMVSHPNDSGMVMDQVSRLFTPARFVRSIEIADDRGVVLSADLDFSISENPNLRFYVLPDEGGQLRAEVSDSHGTTFRSALSEPARLTDPAPVAIAPGVYLVPGLGGDAAPANRGRIANAGFIVGPDGVIAIDTGTSMRHGQALLAAIAAVTDKPVRLALITHTRPDVLFGALAFRARGIPLRMHRAAAALMASRCEQCLKRLQRTLGDDEMQGTAMFTPDELFDDTHTLALIGRPVQVIFLGASSGPGDVLVLDPGSGVLFAGGLLENHRLPDLHDGSVAGWRTALAALRKLPATRYVPGHGPAGPAAMIDEVDRYLVQLDATVRSAMRQGVSLAAAPEATGLPGYAGWDQYDALHRRNVDELYLRLEKADAEAALKTATTTVAPKAPAPALSPQ